MPSARSMSRSRSGSGAQIAAAEDAAASKVPAPFNYLVEPSEVRAIQRRLAALHLWTPPTAPVTPAPSVPSTPTVLIQPSAYASWTDDDYLPLTSRKASRAFLLGAAANTAVDGLLPAVLGKKSFKEGFKTFLTRRSLQTGLGLALYVSLYRTLLQLLLIIRVKTLLPKLNAYMQRQKRASTSSKESDEPGLKERVSAKTVQLLHSHSLAPLLASNLSIPSLLLVPAELRRYIALDILVKALHAAYDEARRNKSRLVSWVPEWMGGGLIYAIGNGQLLWAFLFEPDSFPSSYGNIILSRSTAYIPPRPAHLPSAVPWPSKREIANTVAQLSTPSKTKAAYPSFSSPLLAALKPSPYPTSAYPIINPILDYAPAHPAHENLLCAVLHPTEPSCRKNFLTFWKAEWVASARFVALFAGAAQLLSIKKAFKDPEMAVFKYGMAIVQGATVISGSIGSAWALTCFFQKYLPKTLLPRSRYFLNGFLSSIFILAVPTSRRIELGLYVAKMSARSSWHILQRRNVIRAVPSGDLLLLAAGISLLSAFYEDRPRSLERNIRTAFRMLIGPRQGGEGAITVGQQTSGEMDNSYFFAKEKLKRLSSINDKTPAAQRSGSGSARNDEEDTETEDEKEETPRDIGSRWKARFR